MIILFLYNLAVYNPQGRQAIHDATTNELLLVLPTIESDLKKRRGERAARRTRMRIKTIWPAYRSPVDSVAAARLTANRLRKAGITTYHSSYNQVELEL
jgi:hypothetical protein